MMGHPTHPSKIGTPTVKVRRGGMGHSTSGTAWKGKGRDPRTPAYVRMDIMPRWAKKYLGSRANAC